MNKLACILIALLLGGCSKSPSPSPTPSATRSSLLEQARQQFQTSQFDQSASSAALALEVAKEAHDAPAELEARCLVACSEAHLSGPFPLKSLKELQQEKALSVADRQRVESELKAYQEKALTGLKAAEKSFAEKKTQQSLDETQAALNQLAAIGDRSQDGTAKFRIAECYRILGDKTKAEDFLEEAAHSQPPSAEAVKLLAASKPKVPAHSGPRRDVDGNLGIFSQGGLSVVLDARNHIKLVVSQGESDQVGIALTPEEWAEFKTAAREMEDELEKMQDSGKGGGHSRGVVTGYSVDMAICVGTFRSYGGWQTTSGQPKMELWLFDKLKGSSTPWRVDIGGGTGTMIRQVDAFMKTAPPPLDYDPKAVVPSRLAGKWSGSPGAYLPGFELWFSGTPQNVKGVMVYQGRSAYANLSGKLQDRTLTFTMKDHRGKYMGQGYFEVDNERGASFKGIFQNADGSKADFTGSK